VPGMGLGLVFSGIVSPDMLAVGEVLSTMKLTLNALSTTFDALGEQTEKVVTLGPAMEASGQVCAQFFHTAAALSCFDIIFGTD